MLNFIEPIYGSTPEAWTLTTIGILIEGGKANLQTGPFGTMLHAAAYKTWGTPVVAVLHIGNNRLLHHDLPRVDEETRERLRKYSLLTGDILFGRKGAVDRRALIREEEEGWLQGSDCIRLRFLDKTVDARYISYVLGSSSYRDWIVRHAQGATMPSLNQEILSRIPVPLPSPQEQRAIASVLGSLDDKIELNRRENETLEATARALFQSWFVDFDPVRAKAEGRQPSSMDAETAVLFPDSFEDSPLGPIPQGWRIHKIEEITERVAMGPFGSSIKVSTFVQEGIPVISGQHLHNTLLNDSEFNFVTLEHAEKLKRCNVQRGDVIFTHAGSIGQVSYIPETSQYERYIISQRQFYLRCDPRKISPLYVVSYFKTSEGQHQLLANTSSTGVPSISQPVSYLRQIKILVPPPDLLGIYDSTVRSVYSKVAQNIINSRTLAATRDALLPKLLSGEVRVGEVNI
ncbi:MAG: restriction endonuclease subunit S [Anaerolineae bacterium]|nr:restriction endonuclease subunit S [Anaerolineae bacterium]